MKIQNNNYYSPNFHAGLTKQMKQEIASCNIQKISKEFAKNGILTDFKDNKTVAWCSLKCLEIIKNINEQFNLNLGLPRGIFVEDFNKLDIKNKNSIGVCNVFPVDLYKGSSIIIPEKTIFFNELPEEKFFWENIDAHADITKAISISASDFFLDTFLHEFAHAIHEEHLLEKIGSKKLFDICQKIMTNKFKNKFNDKYYRTLYNNCCGYAASHPMEAIACDLSKRIIESLDKNTLLPKTNFTQNSPYRKFSLKEILLSPIKDEKYDQIIRNFWNGKFK